MRRILTALGLAVVAVMMIAAFPHIQVDDGKILVTDGKIQFEVPGYRYYMLYVTAYNTETLVAELMVFNATGCITPTNMTSATNPAPYVVTANNSYEGDANWRKWYAFDSFTNTSPIGDIGWNAQTTVPTWIKIDLGANYTATSYQIWKTFNVGCPRSWSLQGSVDDVNWVVLDGKTNIESWTINTAVTYDLE